MSFCVSGPQVLSVLYTSFAEGGKLDMRQVSVLIFLL
jgi:hypothetical protein